LKIYLLLLDHARSFFYADESADKDTADLDDLPVPPPQGLYGWFQVRYRKFQSAWQHADSGALLWMRRSWDWLHSWAHPDETMLARLWSAREISLNYPAARTPDDVRVIWADYLKKQWWRHLVWLIVNGVIAPFSVVFAILPGPNLIGYWFAYRAIHHLLVVWGIGRVRRNKVPTELCPMAALDVPIEYGGDGKGRHVALAGDTSRLDDHVKWHNSPHRARGASGPSFAPPTDDPEFANSPVDKT
jgi:hypothetical protein